MITEILCLLSRESFAGVVSAGDSAVLESAGPAAAVGTSTFLFASCTKLGMDVVVFAMLVPMHVLSGRHTSINASCLASAAPTATQRVASRRLQPANSCSLDPWSSGEPRLFGDRS